MEIERELKLFGIGFNRTEAQAIAGGLSKFSDETYYAADKSSLNDAFNSIIESLFEEVVAPSPKNTENGIVSLENPNKIISIKINGNTISKEDMISKGWLLEDKLNVNKIKEDYGEIPRSIIINYTS